MVPVNTNPWRKLMHHLIVIYRVDGVESLFLILSKFKESFFSTPHFFPLKNEETSIPPPFGVLIGVYKFYENWSTETFMVATFASN
jgi:hypothetical protein